MMPLFLAFLAGFNACAFMHTGNSGSCVMAILLTVYLLFIRDRLK